MNTISEKQTLLAALQAQRDHVSGIVADLDDESARRPIAPSGWSVLGLLRHLTRGDERFWFSAVIAADESAISATFAESETWQVEPGLTLATAIAGYRAECDRASSILEQAELDAAPAWWPEEFFGDWRLDNVRQIVLHVITETATHAGHLDLVRELVDGRQWIVLDEGR